MSLVRCTQLLRRNNASFLNAFKNSAVFYSDDKKSSDDGTQNDQKSEANEKDDKKPPKKAKGATKTFSPDSQNRLNDLLKKLASRSTLEVVKEVQASKPLGYQKLRQNQKLDAKERKPRSLPEAAQAVSEELGDGKVKDEVLKPFGADKDEMGFLDDVISKMKTPAGRKEKSSKTPVTGVFTADNTHRENPIRRRKHLLQRASDELTKKDRSVAENVTDVFAGQPIGIFQSVEELRTEPDQLKTWKKLEDHELRLRMSMAPRNYFEKMAHWTEEGKVWHFPIDNEQGLDEELQTSFTEHVFLEEHLEPWCPKKGSIRNFMELVCIGLSKNPYLNVQQKRDHIEWYKNYFEEKRDILQRVIEENKKVAKQISDETQNA